MFAGNVVPAGAEPIAQASYAGHQFGGFTPQLGDGRAVLLGEVIDRHGRRRDIALKGSGRTPFSRGGDGKAAVGPVLREYLIGEAMHALGIPTTRALAAVAHRRGGVARPAAPRRAADPRGREPRAGRDVPVLRRARRARHACARWRTTSSPVTIPTSAADPDRYLGLLRRVASRQAALVAQWMLVGFIHGVMNTDNMTVSGETIDYGPCAFMEAYDPRTVFSSIDAHGRYAYGNQPPIARWNLARLAETLLPLIDDVDGAGGRARDRGDRRVPRPVRLALARGRARQARPGDRRGRATRRSPPTGWRCWRRTRSTSRWRGGGSATPPPATSARSPRCSRIRRRPRRWLERWRQRAAAGAACGRRAAGRHAPRQPAVHPAQSPRRGGARRAASEHGDLAPFERLLEVVTHPFDERAGLEAYASRPRARSRRDTRTYCGLRRAG